jgi:hypothetical protein
LFGLTGIKATFPKTKESGPLGCWVVTVQSPCLFEPLSLREMGYEEGGLNGYVGFASAEGEVGSEPIYETLIG